MEDELKDEETVEDNSMYIDEINKLKETTVSKDKYEKLKAENKKLLSSLVNGDKIEEDKKTVDIEECRRKMMSEDISNVEYCQCALDLRNYYKEEKGIDLFLPRGRDIQPTEDDCKKAQNVADVLEDCLEQAEGNNDIFTGLLNSRIAEDSPTARLKKAKIKK